MKLVRGQTEINDLSMWGKIFEDFLFEIPFVMFIKENGLEVITGIV